MDAWIIVINFIEINKTMINLKQKIFGMYWGQKVLEYASPSLKFVDYTVFSSEIYKSKNSSLFLRQLSMIRDEELIEVGNILCLGDTCSIGERNEYMATIVGFNNNIEPDVKVVFWFDGDMLCEDTQLDVKILSAYDLLRSKGYALPCFGYSVEDLVERKIFKLKKHGKED